LPPPIVNRLVISAVDGQCLYIACVQISGLEWRDDPQLLAGNIPILKIQARVLYRMLDLMPFALSNGIKDQFAVAAWVAVGHG